MNILSTVYGVVVVVGCVLQQLYGRRKCLYSLEECVGVEYCSLLFSQNGKFNLLPCCCCCLGWWGSGDFCFEYCLQQKCCCLVTECSLDDIRHASTVMVTAVVLPLSRSFAETFNSAQSRKINLRTSARSKKELLLGWI